MLQFLFLNKLNFFVLIAFLGLSCAQAITKCYPSQDANLKKILVLCGPGIIKFVIITGLILNIFIMNKLSRYNFTQLFIYALKEIMVEMVWYVRDIYQLLIQPINPLSYTLKEGNQNCFKIW